MSTEKTKLKKIVAISSERKHELIKQLESIFQEFGNSGNCLIIAYDDEASNETIIRAACTKSFALKINIHLLDF